MKALQMLNRLAVQSRVISASAARCQYRSKLQTRFIPTVIPTVSQYQRTHYATVSNIPVAAPGFWKNLRRKLGFKEKMRYHKMNMFIASRRLYICISEMIDVSEMIKELELKDSFHTWFIILDLHIWLVMVRLAQLNQEGRFIRNELIKGMWEDVEKRSKVILEDQYYAGRRKFIESLHGQFQLSLFAYDEGLLSDDRVLACALWRMLFNMGDVKPEKLALMVEYVRKQVQFIDKQNSEDILKHGLVCFLPLYGGEENNMKNKQLLEKIRKYIL